jgi:hypothetical protein
VQHEDDGPTYVYHAAIRNADGVVLGGIGLVFHAQREFKAMLEGVTGVQAGGAGSRQVAYLNRSGLVMSSSDVQLQPGMQLDLPPQMLALAPGQSMARAMVYQGQYCVVAITAGSGYREFKRSDGYREEVLALSVQAFGAVQDDALAAVSRRNTRVQSLAAASQGSAAGMEMATFFVGRSVLAVDAACVLEAQSASAIAPVSAGRLPHCVGTLARRSQGRGRLCMGLRSGGAALWQARDQDGAKPGDRAGAPGAQAGRAGQRSRRRGALRERAVATGSCNGGCGGSAGGPLDPGQ